MPSIYWFKRQYPKKHGGLTRHQPKVKHVERYSGIGEWENVTKFLNNNIINDALEENESFGLGMSLRLTEEG